MCDGDSGRVRACPLASLAHRCYNHQCPVRIFKPLRTGEEGYRQLDDGPSIVVLKLLVATVVLGAEGFFAAAEIGLLGVGRIQLRRLADKGNKHARMVQRMFANPARLVATVLVTITTLLYVAEALATDAALDFVSAYGSGWVEFVIPTSFALIALIFAELAPVLYASAHPRKVALTAAIPVRIAGVLLYPLIAFVSVVSNRLLRLLGCDPRHHRPLITEAEIVTLIKIAEEQGAIAREERQMLHSALEFPEVRVGELMVRRVDMVCIPADMLLRDAVRRMVEVGHSRVPVYQSTIDEIIGILYAKDALAAWHRGDAGRDRPRGLLTAAGDAGVVG
ncbi:MAG TPA: DUF21 domain-containing protein [Armatimonadetes bacterium]|nr:DUF21 domain-containing protein [Armatimonadota bacterium]